MRRLVGPMASARRLLDIITKKCACFFGCSSERFCRFCGPVIPNRWHGVAVRHVWCCERCLSAPRLGRYRLAVSHVSRRKTCLTARWNMKFGEWNVRLLAQRADWQIVMKTRQESRICAQYFRRREETCSLWYRLLGLFNRLLRRNIPVITTYVL